MSENILWKTCLKKNILDLFLTDNPHAYSRCKTVNMKPHSDHKMVNFQLTTHTDIQDSNNNFSEYPEAATFNYHRADKKKVKENINNTKWEECLKSGDVKKKYDELVVQCLIKADVPKIKKHAQSQSFSKEVNDMKKQVDDIEKASQHKHARDSDIVKANQKIEGLHERIQKLLDEKERAKEDKLLKGIKRNSKAFYKEANKSRKGRSKIGPLLNGNKYESDPKRIAEILSNQFESVLSTPMKDISYHTNKKLTTATLNDIIITKDDIKQAIKEIQNDSAAGPDGIPVIFYKDYADEMAGPLLMLWRHSLDCGDQPDEPILAVITPLHKGGPKCYAVNYRPVALTNHLTKIFERVLKKAITGYLEENGLMNPTQHGFRSGRSTMTQLLNYYESIMEILIEGHSVDSIYLDFSKAFDKVDHNILLAKLSNLGIGGKIYNWIASFLKNRQQAVRVEGQLSEKVWVRSGVPQGSVLGPLLFLIMMLDITDNIQNSNLSSFADDTRLWMRIKNLLDTKKLQEDLHTLYRWTDANNASFNADKFEGQSYGINEEQHYLAPDITQITQNNVLKDLGVHMQEDMTFKQHIKNTVAKGQRMSGWILRTIKSRSAPHMKILLQQLVVSQMEYCSILWSPRDKEQIDLIESVQAEFTRKIAQYQTYDDTLQMPICTKSYPERLADLKIYSLERRRERMQILYLYKMILQAVPNPGFEWNYCTRNKELTVTPKTSRKSGWAHTLRNSSFAVIGPKLFNSLPKELRKLPDESKTAKQNIRSFKIAVDNYLKGIPDIPGSKNSLLYHKGINYDGINSARNKPFVSRWD